MSSMLKVALISPLPPEKAGEAPYTASLIESLVSQFRIKITAIGGPTSKPIMPENPRVRTYSIWEGSKLSYIVKILRFLRKTRPHILHVQFGPHGEVYGGMFGEYMLLLLLLAKQIGIKTTITLHSTWMPHQVKERIETYDSLRPLSDIAPPMFRLYNKLLDWGTDTIQLSTSGINSRLRKAFLAAYDMEPDKVLEIPHPCKTLDRKIGKDAALDELGFADKDIILLFGFIRRGKGIETAIGAMRELGSQGERTVLVIAGSPQDRDGEQYLRELKDYVDKIGVAKKVVFLDEYIPEERVPMLFHAASAVVIPYTESVGASGPMHNFAGYGVPMIVSDVGLHMRDALDGSVVLFEKGDAKDLANKLNHVLGDKTVAENLSRQHKRYAERETWDRAARRTMKYYKKTLEK